MGLPLDSHEDRLKLPPDLPEKESRIHRYKMTHWKNHNIYIYTHTYILMIHAYVHTYIHEYMLHTCIPPFRRPTLPL